MPLIEKMYDRDGTHRSSHLYFRSTDEALRYQRATGVHLGTPRIHKRGYVTVIVAPKYHTKLCRSGATTWEATLWQQFLMGCRPLDNTVA